MLRHIACLVALLAPLSAVDIGPIPVVKVTDGDTFVVQLAGKEERVRLLYVNTPKPADSDEVEAMPEGLKAKEFLAGLLPVQSYVTLHGPNANLERDKQGDISAIVTQLRGADGKPQPEPDKTQRPRVSTVLCINAEVIRAGWSPYWIGHGLAPDAYDGGFRLAQQQADTDGVGMWSCNLEWIQKKANERPAP